MAIRCIWCVVGRMVEAGPSHVGEFFRWAGTAIFRLPDPATRRRAAFSVAMIALAAKMARADGVVTLEEEEAFERLFDVPPGERRNVRRLFDLAKQHTSGFDHYAARIAHLYSHDARVLEDVLDGLFMIAAADGAIHEAELVYLENVAVILGMEEVAFERVAARHTIGKSGDPYLVLEAKRSWPLDNIRRQYRRLVAENHPDKLIGRGMPPEFIAIASDRVAAMNAAWERIKRVHPPVLEAT